MARAQRFWLIKSEPDVFSFDDLWKARRRTTYWDGVRNYQARNFMRDDMALGDGILYYHSACPVPGIAGIAEVASKAKPDPTQFDPKDSHYDAKSSPDEPRWCAVDVRAVELFPSFVSLEALRAEPKLAQMRTLQRGNRLSITPVTATEWRLVRSLAGLGARSKASS